MSGQTDLATTWKFADILAADPQIKAKWNKVRQYFFLRESTYDMTRRCNIRCEGCYYYTGDKQFAAEISDEGCWDALMRHEQERGITFAVLAGAEPSLVPQLCRICFTHIPHGAIATNGLKAIPRDIDYRIHISVWGNDATSKKIRGADGMLERQTGNYRDDPRAIFIYTFTPYNIEEARPITAMLAEQGLPISFNMFSAPVGYQGNLRHNRESLARTAKMMSELLAEFPQTVLFSHYNIAAHTNDQGLHELFSCPYPRRNPATTVGLGRTFRQYRTDLQWDRDAACCVPDTDCDDCRHYAAGSAVVTARMYRHATDPQTFSAWLDYVDTYLAVWVKGYRKGADLCEHPVVPPES